MATVIHSVPGSASLHLRDRLRHGFEIVASFIRTRRERARIIAELNTLDDRDLQDLGISQYDFRAIAEGRITR
jgi:uncharacterized protein YjiS (DUF1127 family)